MSFTPKTFDQIYRQLAESTEQRLPGQMDFEVGSVVRTLYESFAYELALLYEQMDQVYRSAFIDTASGVQLEMVAAILGIRRGLPDFAEGEVTFTRDPGSEDLVIPVGTLVTTEDSDESPRRAYTTLEAITFPASATAINAKVQAVNRGEDQTVPAASITVMPLPVSGVKAVVNREATQFLGKRKETDDELRQRAKSMLLASGKASLTAIETALLSLPGVREVKVVEPFAEAGGGFGVLDVYVDGTNMHQPERYDELRQCIDQVRAAGVYVRLQQPDIVELDGLVYVVPDGTVPSEVDVMNAVEAAIATHLTAVSIGQPLLFPPLTQAILAVPGVGNLEDFALLPTPLPPRHADRTEPFHSRDKRIDMASNATKFRQHHLTVVTQVQPLKVGVSLRIAMTDEATAPEPATIVAALKPEFDALQPGQSITRTTVQEALTREIPGLTIRNLSLTPLHPSRFVQQTEETLTPSFAEQLRLQESTIFVYQTTLDLVGALKFIPDDRATAAQRTATAEQIRQRVDRYLDQLAPEQAINLDELWTAAQGDQTQLAPLEVNDFRALVAGTDRDRLDPATHRITVEPLEKAQARHLLITSGVEPMTLTLTTLTVVVMPLPTIPETPDAASDAEASTEAESTGPATDAEDRLVNLTQRLEVRLRDTINTFPKQAIGTNFNLETLQHALHTLGETTPELRAIPYRITELALTATSADDRTQTATLTTAPTIHVRSHERPTHFNAPPNITLQIAPS